MSEPQRTRKRFKKQHWLLLGALLLVLLLILGGVGVSFWLRAHDTTGLEGTWSSTTNPKHKYEFNSRGGVDCWVGSKSWVNRLGWSASWSRSGNTITIRTDRNWDFKGELRDGEIHGETIIRDPDGTVVVVVPEIWQRISQHTLHTDEATPEPAP